VIADDSGVLGLGGIMGGESTGCTEATTDVLTEAAYFDPVRTANTGRATGIVSDARYRFERGVDPQSEDPFGGRGIRTDDLDNSAVIDLSVTYTSGDLPSPQPLPSSLGNRHVTSLMNPLATACPGDFNHDGVLDNGDIASFVQSYLAAVSDGGESFIDIHTADYNDDGVLDNADITEFVYQFLAGC